MNETRRVRRAGVAAATAGIGFAIPSNQATAIAGQIISSGHVTSPVSSASAGRN